MTYNPFDKLPFDTLNVDDLNQLIENNVAEGYYVEYKSQFVKNEKIGWSISSFANSYGGWYIVGVKTDEHNVATDICGFNLSDCPDPIDKIREIVKSNIDPQPLFYPQVIKIGENKAVLVFYIPDNQDKPFICKNGRIYRRIADSSDPVLEGNRYALDKLYEEGKEIKNKFREFCQDRRVHSDENGWIKIFISPYPLGILDDNFDLDFYREKNLERIIELSKKQIKIPYFDTELTGSIPFTSGQTTSESLIFRQIEQLAYNSLEFELFDNFQAKIFVPLRYSEPWHSDIFHSLTEPTRKILSDLHESKNIAENGNPDSLLHFFQLDAMYIMMVHLISFYQHILNSQPSQIDKVEVIIKIENVWRHTPFFDFERWAEYVNSFGLPVINRNSSIIEKRNGRGIQLKCNKNSELWLGICGFVGNEFGFPFPLTNDIVHESLARAAEKSK